MQFTGKITVKTEKIFIGANNTPKLSLILEEAEDKQYKDSIMIDWIGDEKVALVENLPVGSTITVHFNTRATEYNGRHYNNLNGWRIEGQQAAPVADAPATKKADKIEEDFDDLPF
jgi:hypothetical protein